MGTKLFGPERLTDLGLSVHTIDVALPHEEGDPMRKGTRLPAARPGDDQDRPLRVQHGFALDVVEAAEQRRGHAHEGSLGGAADAPAGWP